MPVTDLSVIAAGATLNAQLAWYFFGPRKAGTAQLVDGVQEAQVTVKGGYSPDLIRVKQNVPLRIAFDRQESGECTSRVVFPDFELNRALPANAETAIELMPDRSGEFGFACGMNMVHGRLVVEPVAASESDGHEESVAAVPARAIEPRPASSEPLLDDSEAAERKAEIADLTGRVIVGAAL